MRRVATRLVHSSSAARALPALANDAPKSGFLSRLLGGGRAVSLPPMTEPLAGVTIPVYTPPASAPTTAQKKLANGAVLAAEETPGATVALGVYVDSGSKYETPASAGASHLLERLAFKATQNRSAFRLTREAEVIGANLLASASREQMSYTVDCLKTHLAEASELLLDSVLNPKFEAHTVGEAVVKLKADVAELEGNAQASLMEALHVTAYSGGLGQPLVASAASLSALTPTALYDFVGENYSAPRLALAAAGCSLAQLSAVAEPLLASLPSALPARAADGAYLGGDMRKPTACADGATHLALAFHFSGGWRDVSGATALTVLQLLLGGGGSFSAGGPGKGMYSRLYTRVLNRHAWAHACTGFHSLYNDSGLVGIHATCDAARGADMVDTMCSELLAMAAPGGVSAAELARAKAATISSVLMNLESRAVVAEDIGRQVLTYGARKAPSTFLDQVARLTEKDLQTAVAKLLKSPPTFVAIGETGSLPRYEAIAKRF